MDDWIRRVVIAGMIGIIGTQAAILIVMVLAVCIREWIADRKRRGRQHKNG